jgi:membrane protein involved in colicin uptake
VETVAFMSRAWAVFTGSLVTGWKTAQNWIAKKFASLMAMFDESVDVELTQQILDDDFQREQRGREQATQQQLRDIETTRQAKRQAIDQEEQATLDELNREKDARHVARKQQNDAEVEAAEEAVHEARTQWQDALDEAARKRAEVAGTAAPDKAKGAGDLEGMDFESLGKRNVSVQGTFNAMAAQGLGAGGPIERVARAGEETAKNTRKLVMQAQHGGLQFT